MKLTSFSPLIMSNNAEGVAEVFEALGFEKRHEKKDVTENKDGGFRMKDANGFGISIAQVNQMPQDMACVQMNIDDIDEAMAFFEERGFKNMSGDGKYVDTGSSKSTVMISPSGFAVNIVYHIK